MWPFRRRRERSPSLSLVSVGTPNRVPATRNPIRAEIEKLAKEERDGAALTASGQLVQHQRASYYRRLIQPWQIRAFGYYDLLGEIKYAAQFYSRALSNLRLFAAELNDEGELVPTEDPDVIAAFERIKDPGGTGRRQLLADYGRLMFLAGESLLFVWNNPDTEMEQWEMLSTDELRMLDGSYTRFLAPSLPAMSFRPAPDDAYVPVGQTRQANGDLWGSYDDTAVAYRLWKRHPRFSMLPDAPMEGVLELCEELVLLTHAVRARARSRLAGSGILFIDDRITTRPLEATPDEDVLEDPFLADMTESMTLPITDEGTASAVVPLLARVKVPDGVRLSDLVYHLQVIDPTQVYPETGLRMECVRRIAICLDMPPEVLLGLGTLNHWNVWGIDEQSWKYHLQPIAEHLVGDLTNAYLGPYLRKMGRKDWARFAIDYDPSAVINHPDRSKDAKDLHDRGVIGDTALREATGFTEDDKPKKDELARVVGVAVRDGSLAWFGEPAPRGGYVETAPGEIVSGQPPDGTPGSATDKAKPGAPTAASTDKKPPEKDAATASGISAGMASSVAAMIAGASGLGVLRAREAAGSRIRTLARRDPDALELLNGTSPRDVAAVLGRVKVRELAGRQSEAELVSGARPLIVDAVRSYGVDDSVAVAVAEALEAHAVRTLYDARFPILPPDFDRFIFGLLTAAGG